MLRLQKNKQHANKAKKSNITRRVAKKAKLARPTKSNNYTGSINNLASFHTTRPAFDATTNNNNEQQGVVKQKRKVKRGMKGLTSSTNVLNHQPIDASPHGVLGRDFVRESLYSKQGYFNASRVINSPGVIKFKELVGKAQYEKRLADLYYQGVQGWTTPVEIFQPFYGHSIARFFLQHLVSGINEKSEVDFATAVRLYQAVAKRMARDGMLDVENNATEAHKTVLRQIRHLNDQADFWPTYNEAHQQIYDTTQLPPHTKDLENIVDYIFRNKEQHNLINGLPLEIDATLRRFGKGELLQISKENIAPSAGVKKTRIVEIGAGNGTCASNILDMLNIFFPNIYKNTSYTIFEMSEQLSHQQKELLDNVHHGKYNVLNINAAEYIPFLHDKNAVNNKLKQPSSPSSSDNDEHAFVFGLEVLDNMVHDKVIRGTDGKFYQIMVADIAYMNKLRQDFQQGNVNKIHKLKKYPHPNDEFDFYQQQLISELETSTTATTTKTVNTANNKPSVSNNNNTESSETTTTPQTIAQQKQQELYNQYTEFTTEELLHYAFNKPLPIDYQKLNRTQEDDIKYMEYAIPITDPIIQECLDLWNSYQSTSPYYNKHNKTGAINFQHQFNDAKFTGTTNKKGIFQRLVNKVLKRSLAADENADDVVYLPTELLRFVHRINRAFPSHTLLLADFDILPTTEMIRARHAPVVAKKAEDAELRGKTIDKDTYMVELGQCDIFYPTDFNFLRHIYSTVVLGPKHQTSDGQIDYNAIHNTLTPYMADLQKLADEPPTTADPETRKKRTKQNTEKLKQILSQPTPIRDLSVAITQNEFLHKYASIEHTQCRNGFNPMLEDYNNMAMFIGQRK